MQSTRKQLCEVISHANSNSLAKLELTFQFSLKGNEIEIRFKIFNMTVIKWQV